MAAVQPAQQGMAPPPPPPPAADSLSPAGHQGDDELDPVDSMEGGPDLPDEPPWEGRVNDPMPTRGPEIRHGNGGIQFSPKDRQVLELYVPADIRTDMGLEERDYLGPIDQTLRQPPRNVLQMKREEKLAEEDAEITPGLENMMTDLQELIEALPLENVVEDSLPAYLRVRHPPKLPTAQPDAPLAPYDPSDRPTSRWRCRWRLISPEDEHSNKDFNMQHARDFLDFRNPYVKALNSTREELQKSWDLTCETSAASRLATQRDDALASMHVFEMDDEIHRPSHLLACMPEPCRETCREDGVLHQSEMCEVKVCQAEFDRMLNRHPGPALKNVGPTMPGATPSVARCEHVMLSSSLHPGQGVADEEIYMHPGDLSGLDDLKYVREEV